MKPTKTILMCVLAAGLASAQSPSIIQNTRATMNGVRDNATVAQNAALGNQDKVPSAAAATHPAKATAATPAPARTAVAISTKPVATKTAVGTKPVSTKPVVTKTVNVAAHSKAKIQASPIAPKKDAPVAEKAPAAATTTATVAGDKPADDNSGPEPNKWAASGKRDPFLSPVVSHAGGSGCSTGKKCLEIGTINLHGIVHAESGFIAVVSNGMNKAYFLRENDPVFNGYVVKITGDSITFQETLQDRMGKTFTREVVKKITTPAV